MNDACKNTDKEIWRERPGDYYADSIHVTEHGGIGIECGGYVIVKSVRKWHEVANLVDNFELRNVSKWRKKLAMWLLKANDPIKFQKL